MNGLRFIRVQCNYSISELADKMGVSRQLISAWENERKNIPERRLTQLSELFGIDGLYFGSISESKKQELVNKAMFLYEENGKEYYKYSYDIKTAKRAAAHFIP